MNPPADPRIPILFGAQPGPTDAILVESGQPTPETAYAAEVAADELLARDLRAVIVDPPATAKGAYPITGITFILIPKDNTSSDGEQKALKEYIDYTLTTGQDSAGELSYAKLPDSVQKAAEGLLSQLTDNGKTIQ